MGEAIGECLSLIGVDGLPPLPSLGELLTVTPFALSALDAPTSAPPSAPPRSPPRPAPCALASALCRLWRALPRAVLTRHVLSLEPFLGAASAQRFVLPCLEAALLPPPTADPAAAAALPAFTTATLLPAAVPAAAPDVLMLPIAAEASGAAATEGGEPTQRDGGLARGGLAREAREGRRGRAAQSAEEGLVSPHGIPTHADSRQPGLHTCTADRECTPLAGRALSEAREHTRPKDIQPRDLERHTRASRGVK